MKPREAATILGVPVREVRAMQKNGLMPDPIPDDYLDAVVRFRLDLEKALRRKIDRSRGTE